ncbi:MAG: hypothetical protein JW973_17900 [Bacteroidales bacterium]|nr:hypothetical protein [Bacteroidales bacterium]
MNGEYLPSKLTKKTFWQRPEGVTSLLFLAAIIVGGGALLYKILPFIIGLLSNAIHAAILFAVLGGIIYVLLDKKFRTLIWYMYKSVMRWITGLFVQINPISILNTYIEYLHKNVEEMNGHIGKLKGQMTKLKTLMETNAGEMKENLEIAEQAKKKGNMELVAVNTRQYGRLEETNKRYLDLYNKMEILYKVLSKIHKNSGYLVKDVENEIRMKTQEREAIRSGYSALKHAMNILKGDPDKKMMFDQAMEAIVDDVSYKVGEMDRFIEISADFINSIDLQNGVYEQRGIELLEKMEKQGIALLDPSRGLPGHSSSKLDEQIKDSQKAEPVREEDTDLKKYKDLF